MLRQETVSSREVILVVSGPLSGDAVTECHGKMEELCAGRFQKITLDLSQVPSINSSALGKMLLFHKKLVANGGTLQIKGCNEGLYKIFQAIQFDKLFQIQK
jgi:anti-anti-sigma factor